LLFFVAILFTFFMRKIGTFRYSMGYYKGDLLRNAVIFRQCRESES